MWFQFFLTWMGTESDGKRFTNIQNPSNQSITCSSNFSKGKIESHFVILLYMSFEVGVQILMRVHALDARWLGGKGGI